MLWSRVLSLALANVSHQLGLLYLLCACRYNIYICHHDLNAEALLRNFPNALPCGTVLDTYLYIHLTIKIHVTCAK